MSHQAITTRYAGPTDSRGARVIAQCEALRIVVPWDYGRGAPGNHALAALELARRMGWGGTWVAGSTRVGYVIVCLRRQRGEATQRFTLRDSCGLIYQGP